MNDYRYLAKALQDLIGVLRGKPYNLTAAPATLQDAADAITELHSQTIRWIDAADFLPDLTFDRWKFQRYQPETDKVLTSETVLVTDGKRIACGFVCNRLGEWLTDGEVDEERITHWAKRPKLPGEG